MKYLVVDDETQLYQQMFADLWKASDYDIEEIPKICINKILRFFYKVHFSSKLNRWGIDLPFKSFWNRYYGLGRYDFQEDEEYCVIILNGALKYHYSFKYLKSFKQKHQNVSMVLLMYDNYEISEFKQRLEQMLPLFKMVISFDPNDCKKYGFEYIYQTFSKPDFIYKESKKETDLFFVGMAFQRSEILHSVYKKISGRCKSKIHIVGIPKHEQLSDSSIYYNLPISYEEELQYAYNTNCILEVVKPGQAGITLRTCEAICFNKKLLTNNLYLRKMPFYDERYMQVFDNIDEIDINFITEKIKVEYEESNIFTPLKIIEKIESMD